MRKVRYKYTCSDPDPVFEGDNPNWTLQSDEFYVRDVSGKEIAIYSGNSLTQWNIWGLDNPPGGGQVIGKINADTTRNYYLKDHLGSVRVVLNSTNNVISAQDYDAWGYPLENRTYNTTAMKYDFTGKERDDETSYDYFGARYYDSRIGRWGGEDQILNVGMSPYSGMNCNPLTWVDINGLENIIVIGGFDVSGIDAYKFVNSGVDAAIDYSESNTELTTIVLLASHMSENDISDTRDFLMKEDGGQNINFVVAYSSEELVNYMNSKSTNTSGLSNERSNDAITDLLVFGHGHAGLMDFGYGGNKNSESQYNFSSNEINSLNSGAFANDSYISLFNCNAATTNSINGSNIARDLSSISKGASYGYASLVDYSKIYTWMQKHVTRKGGLNNFVRGTDRPSPEDENNKLKSYYNGKEQ